MSYQMSEKQKAHREEVKTRILAWEKRNNKKLEECNDQEWIEAARTILALTKLEAEGYLTHLRTIKSEM